MTEHRFALEWDRPMLSGALTHVSLFEGGKHPQHVIASGHGPNDADALSDLLTMLKGESAEAIAYVSEQYAALTGRAPVGSKR